MNAPKSKKTKIQVDSPKGKSAAFSCSPVEPIVGCEQPELQRSLLVGSCVEKTQGDFGIQEQSWSSAQTPTASSRIPVTPNKQEDSIAGCNGASPVSMCLIAAQNA
jgi:hypothetical protein